MEKLILLVMGNSHLLWLNNAPFLEHHPFFADLLFFS